MKEWTDVEKAIWILQNNSNWTEESKYTYVFERKPEQTLGGVGYRTFRRPIEIEGGGKIPPWVDTQRKEIKTKAKRRTGFNDN